VWLLVSFAIGLVGWLTAMVRIATGDTVAVFGGVLAVTIVIVRGFFVLERGADDRGRNDPLSRGS
jgi:hypothetical protein